MSKTIELKEMLSRWNSPDGHPYKGTLIDWDKYTEDPDNIGCMCAQGQILHLMAGWEPHQLLKVDQGEADREVAKLLNISTAHAILLRVINDRQDGVPSLVLTNPKKVIGDQAHVVLSFWRHMDQMTVEKWAAARATAWDADRAAATAAARAAAWDTDRAAAWAIAGAVAGVAGDDARDTAGAATCEIIGAQVMRDRGQAFSFLPLFGFSEPEEIPPLPADYGHPDIP